MSSFEVSTEELQGIYGGVGKICPALPQIGLIAPLPSDSNNPAYIYLTAQVIDYVDH